MMMKKVLLPLNAHKSIFLNINYKAQSPHWNVTTVLSTMHLMLKNQVW